MLVCFLKRDNEANAICQIAKYADRIYIQPSLLSKKSSLTILRSICVEVLPDSPRPIRGIGMLCPGKPESIENLSNMLLSTNGITRAATSFDVLSQNQRTIAWDGLPDPIRVPAEVTLKAVPMGNCTLVEISFNDELQPGHRFAIVLRMVCRDRLTKLSFFRRELKLAYFFGPQPPPSPLGSIQADREIPCLTYYSGDPAAPRVAGGFDILVSHPRSLKISAAPTPTSTQGITYVDARGERLPHPLSNQLWRLRRLTNDKEVRWRTHDQDIRLDIDIPSTWPMFVLGVLASVTVAVIIGAILGPLLRRALLGIP